MPQLPPPPPPPATSPQPVPDQRRGSKKGLTALIIGASLLVLAAAGAAVVIFIPPLAALAGIPGMTPGTAASTPASQASATPSATPTATPSSAASASALPTFEMAPVITSPPPLAEVAPPATSSPTVTAGSGRSSLDLGLAVPVNVVPCHGQYLTFYASAITPASYGAEIQTALNAYPGSSYLVTEGSCSALNQVSRNGTRIYAVYNGPYSTAESACQALAGVPGAYVKLMNPSTTPEASVACG
jgi:hypothetical protein